MKFDAVIFDFDNVLVDTRASYTDCIRKTVESYLVTLLDFRPPRHPLLSRSDVEGFKSLGGFNDDWDTCYGLLLYFLNLKIKKRAIFELEKEKNIPGLVREIKEKPLGVVGAEKKWGKNKEITIGKISGIFQKFYLSEFVWNEKLLIPKSFLKTLKRTGLKFGIVTGRSREEARFALRRFQIDSLIEAMITTDETPKGLRKPDPWGLIKVSNLLGKNGRYAYVGDLPDDILAAKEAKKKIKISSCGFLSVSSQTQEMKKEFKKLKADYLCENAKELKTLILPTRRST